MGRDAADEVAPRVPAVNDLDAEMTERAQDAVRLLHELVPSSAYALCAWNPLSGSHVHREIVSGGYSPEFLEYANDAFIKDDPAFKLLHSRAPLAMRWRDLASDWNLDFSRTRTAEEFLIPQGFREGTTFCLRRRDGRYTGSLHVSWAAVTAASDERREMLERFRPVLAAACDVLGTPKIISSALAPGAHAVVVSTEGVVSALPAHPVGPALAAEGPLRALLTRIPRRRRRFLWADDDGNCHRVTVTPCAGDVSLATEELVPWPYGLTRRELQILHLVTEGCTNPDIASALYISPRTASTHVEHLLAKLGCSARAQLAAIAADEGLVLGRDPRTVTPPRRAGAPGSGGG